MVSDLALWERLHNYSLDAVDAAFPFSHRLARDNGWSHKFARQVIEEYKRFVYLICVADHTFTPSDEVDQVWHLHLTYTRDYWDVFCPQILGRKIHHGPTQGGEAQTQSFKAAYEETLRAYELEFGPPPKAIWPGTDIRFTRPLNFKRIDISSVYVLPKWQVFLCLGGATALLLGACKATAIMERINFKAAWPVIFIGVLIFVFLRSNREADEMSRPKAGRRHKNDNGGGCGGGCSSSDGGGDHGGSGCSGDGGGSGCGGGCGGGGD